MSFALKKVVSSLVFGSTLGASPFVVANSLPSSIEEPKEEGFGKRCLLGREICKFMESTEFERERDVGQEDTSPKGVQEVSNETWRKYLESMGQLKNYCSFGFKNPKLNKILECDPDLEEVKDDE